MFLPQFLGITGPAEGQFLVVTMLKIAVVLSFLTLIGIYFEFVVVNRSRKACMSQQKTEVTPIQNEAGQEKEGEEADNVVKGDEEMVTA